MSTSFHEETGVLVDALPYFDSGYDETGVRQAALALVEEECRRYKPSKNYLHELQPLNLTLFQTDVMKHEFERLEKRMPMETLNMKRYELPPPPSTKQSEVSAWQEAVDNSSAQLEHQACRILNLELMAEYGSQMWREYLKTLQMCLDDAQKQLSQLKHKIQEINLQRKQEQTFAGERLNDLEKTWVHLVSKNYEIECACVELERELNDLKRTRRQQSISEPSAIITTTTTNNQQDVETLTTNTIDNE